MKYFNKFFPFDDRNSHHTSSATLTSSLYSVTFVANPNQKPKTSSNQVTSNQTDSSEDETFSHSKVTIISQGRRSSSSESKLLKSKGKTIDELEEEGEEKEIKGTTKRDTESSLGGYLLSATLGKTIASTSTITPESDQPIEEDDDWILVDNFPPPPPTTTTTIEGTTSTTKTKTKTTSKGHNKRRHGNIRISKLQQMALDKNDVELIKASWLPVRKDPVSHGVLLFKGLFTKFPQYLKFFPQFNDLDLERMHEHKRLLRHAVKVIETVTFVVDSIGDDTKTSLLNEALVNLVRGHLNRKIGLSEFRNLGIVLIDFICDVNNRRGVVSYHHNIASKQAAQLNKSSTSDSSNQSSNDSETMTSALDKIRTSLTSSSSEEESYLASSKNIGENNNSNIQNNYNNNTFGQSNIAKKGVDDLGSNNEFGSISPTKGMKIDTNLLVTAWTKLYSSILDLVKREEDQLMTK